MDTIPPIHSLRRGSILPYESSNAYYEDTRPGLPKRIRNSYAVYPPQTLEDIFPIWGTESAGNQFNTTEIKARFKDKINRCLETGEVLTLSTVVCPPYSKERMGYRKNVGLMEEFSGNFLDHKFLYSYVVIADTFAQTIRLLLSEGVSVNPVFIIGDWALRDLEGIMQKYASESDVLTALDNFSSSAQDYFNINYPELNIKVDRFSRLGINELLPLGMPQTPEGKRDFVDEQLENVQQGTEIDWLKTLTHHLSNVSDEELSQFIEPANWSLFNPPDTHLAKKQWINFFQLLRNTVLSRGTEIGDKYTEMTPFRAGFYDALMKGYEYLKYGQVISGKYPNQIMANFDTKFPAASLYFMEGGIDIIFLDTRNYPINAPKLGIPFNPF